MSSAPWSRTNRSGQPAGERRFEGTQHDDVLGRACSQGVRPGRSRGDRLTREWRQSPRVGFDCRVRWSLHGVEHFGTARDASETGAGFTVRLDSSPRVGDAIRLVYELEEQYHWLLDEAAVVTRCRPRPDGLCDVGVRLREIPM